MMDPITLAIYSLIEQSKPEGVHIKVENPYNTDFMRLLITSKWAQGRTGLLITYIVERVHDYVVAGDPSFFRGDIFQCDLADPTIVESLWSWIQGYTASTDEFGYWKGERVGTPIEEV